MRIPVPGTFCLKAHRNFIGEASAPEVIEVIGDAVKFLIVAAISNSLEPAEIPIDPDLGITVLLQFPREYDLVIRRYARSVGTRDGLIAQRYLYAALLNGIPLPAAEAKQEHNEPQPPSLNASDGGSGPPLRKIKISQQYEFLITEPTVGGLPDWLKPKFKHLLDAAVRRLARNLICSDLNLLRAEAAITRFVDEIEEAVLSLDRGFFKVSVHPGKTEQSLRVSIRCAAGKALPEEEEQRIVTSSFHVPAVSVVRAPSDRKIGFLPAYLTRKKLQEVADRALYKSQRYERRPIAGPSWLPHLKQSLRDALYAQLPPILMKATAPAD